MDSRREVDESGGRRNDKENAMRTIRILCRIVLATAVIAFASIVCLPLGVLVLIGVVFGGDD